MEEAEVSQVVRAEMERLGYDEVFVDDLYNVVGIIKGSGTGLFLMFNGHIDHAGLGRCLSPFRARRSMVLPLGMKDR